MSESVYKSAVPEDSTDAADTRSAETIYRVVFEGIKSEVETPDSFAIKYGLLTNTPVTKIKFMLRNLPKPVLETKNGARARSVLDLIDEAGGTGRIEEFNPEEKLKVEITEEKAAVAESGNENCPKCGFPVKAGDEYCQFCHTPFTEKKSRTIKTIMKSGEGGHLVSPKRLILYIAVLLLVILWNALAG